MAAKALMPLIGCDSQRKTTTEAATVTTTIVTATSTATAAAANTNESNWMLSATFICCLCTLPFLMAFLFSNCFPALSILHFIVYPFLVPIFSITWHLRRLRLQFRRLFIVCIKSLLLLCFSLLLLLFLIVSVCRLCLFPYPQLFVTPKICFAWCFWFQSHLRTTTTDRNFLPYWRTFIGCCVSL